MLAAGSTIGRRYRLISLIGEGGMASVWCASDETLKRSVAIKLLYLRPARDPQASVDQFLREARIAAAVQHRNVIHTVDFGTTDDGIPYMVMELLHGESLAARMARTPPLNLEELVQIAELTLRGLAAVHEAGIVHRDLKPQNIFLQRDGDAVYPKILDFGISRSVDSAALPSPIATQEGIVLGTPHYMAPEQARGETHIDQRADIYSMAAILYEGLTGQLPFDAETPGDLLVKIISSEPIPLATLRPDLPELIVAVISQAMTRDREHRFVDASAFRRALSSAAERCFTDSQSRRSELPARAHRPLMDLPSSLQPTLAQHAQNDVAPQKWGDFEGLDRRAQERGPDGQQRRATDAQARAAAEAPAAERGQEPERRTAEPVRPSPPPAAGHAAAPRPAAPARAGSAVNVPRVSAAEGRVSPRAKGGQGSGALALDLQKDASANVNPNEGPTLGDNPLDAFAGTAAVALELDLEPVRATSPRTSAVQGERRVSTAQAANVGLVNHTRVETRGRSLLWIAPALLLVLLCLLLIAPGLFSYAPPADSQLRAREEQNPATRGSSRTLQRERPTTKPGTPPPERELSE